jgi:predicted Zn-dependent protease
MIIRAFGVVASLIFLAACEGVPVDGPLPAPEAQAAVQTVKPTPANIQAARSFLRVVKTVEPVAERECRARTSGMNCDFNIVVDDRVNQPANAFQTLDRRGRPVIVFTLALIAEARNEDEIAFVMGHEAAHHIAGHIARQQQNAVAGAVIAAAGAVLVGADPEGVQRAQQYGAQLGARSYSKEFELEADALGTVITAKANYDPLVGAQFFARIPDPGDKFLGTHPPNAARVEIVRRTAAGL